MPEKEFVCIACPNLAMTRDFPAPVGRTIT